MDESRWVHASSSQTGSRSTPKHSGKTQSREGGAMGTGTRSTPVHDGSTQGETSGPQRVTSHDTPLNQGAPPGTAAGKPAAPISGHATPEFNGKAFLPK